MNFSLVIHGGAGYLTKENVQPEKEKEYKQKLREALNAGKSILKEGGIALDAVEACIKILEDSPLFNAGKGSVFTNHGENEMDAAIMEGHTLRAGSVARVTTCKNPISAARLVMEKSKHVMLVGRGADAFAKESGLELAEPGYFYDEFRYQQYLRLKDSDQQALDHTKDDKYGTVGAVALDAFGNIAAGTSTGGMTNKKYGRVGDSPIIGAGTYANELCGVSATGHGEFFIRTVVAHEIASLVRYKELSFLEAAQKVIHGDIQKLGGEGGVIGLDRNGDIAMEFNTMGMFRGFVKSTGETEIGIYKKGDTPI